MNQRRLDAGIFLVSASVLLTELLLTRIFSVTLYYHLSFMVVSLAMLGFGASGLAVSLWPNVFSAERAPRQLAFASVALAVATVVAVGVCFRMSVPFDQLAFNALRVAGVFVLCACPFVAGGVVVSLILGHHAAQAHRLYFADLAGAAAGCLIFVPATDALGAPTAILVAAVLACASGIVLAGPSHRGLAALAAVVGVMLLVAAGINLRTGFYDVRFVKGAPQPPTLALRWNSFSRVDVLGTPETLWTPRPPVFAGYSSRLPPAVRVQEAWLRYDADAATQITHFTGDIARLEYLEYDVSSAAYRVKRPNRVLVLGSGGGRDILAARRHGAQDVTGVEINPITIALMRTRFHTFSGGLYDGVPGVKVVNDDARAFLAQTDDKFDVIEASLVDTWAASAAGAYALTENSIYTVDAFDEYLAHLEPNGVAAFNRWFDAIPVESLRVVNLAMTSLRRAGVEDPGAHIYVLCTDTADTGTSSLGSILVKRSPFTGEEIDRLRGWAEDMGFIVKYSPDDRARGLPENEFHRLIGANASAFMTTFPFDLSAVTDDRPFFFNRTPVLPWMATKLGLLKSPFALAPLGLSGRTLAIAIVTSAAFTALLLIVPLLARRRLGLAATGRGRKWALYFGLLGVGYMLVEIVLIQRFSLFLGHPAYSLSVVLFTMLLASGAGSLWGASRSPTWLSRALVVLCVALLAYAIALSPLLAAFRGTERWFRAVISMLLIAPVGLLMGLPFPAGLRAANREQPGLVPWAWAINGGASVLGSSLTVLVSMSFGFTTAMFLGAFCYAGVISLSNTLAKESA